MSDRSSHLRGILITTAGVLVLTPDTLLLRLISADPWTVVFWRGLLMGAVLLAVSGAFRGRRAFQEVRDLGWYAVLAAMLYGANAIFFVLAVANTTVANTLIIVSVAPLMAALLSRLALKEHVPWETWLTILASLVGIALVVGDGFGRGTFGGDVAALLAAAALAGYFVMVRRHRDVNMLATNGLGALASAAIAFAFAAPLAVSGSDALWLGILGLFVLPLSFGLITLGPRYISAPEVSLLFLLETVLGPLWVWLVLSEAPSVLALIGGTVVVVGLLMHSVMRLGRGG